MIGWNAVSMQPLLQDLVDLSPHRPGAEQRADARPEGEPQCCSLQRRQREYDDRGNEDQSSDRGVRPAMPRQDDGRAECGDQPVDHGDSSEEPDAADPQHQRSPKAQ